MTPRTNSQLRHDLSRLTIARLGFDGALVDQGTDEWEQMRLGVVTASRAKDLIAKGRTAGSVGEARRTYMHELIAEIATAQQKRSGGRSSNWGHEYEESCVGLYAFESDAIIEHIPFIYGDDSMRYGCSPDGLIGDLSGIEAKCPHNTAVYLKFVLDGEIKPEYIEQVQFSMFVTGRDHWVFANHDPDVSNYIFHSVTMERDEAKMKTFADAVGQMVHDMDRQLEKLGYTFGDQWKPVSLRLAA
jgi:hypothetical protein